MAKHIIVVDDDRQITEFLARFLSKQGYQVATAGSAKQMALLMEHREFDLLILDVGLPDTDGFQVTRELRKTTAMPIILLTVRNEVYDKIIGLEIGADDYVAKPFEPHELLARIRAVLRRSDGEVFAKVSDMKVRKVTFSEFELDTETRKVTSQQGSDVPLTFSEYTLVAALVHRAGEVITRDQLMDLIYSGSIHVTDRAVDAHVARVRRKLALAGAEGDIIKTVHGKGYYLSGSVHVRSE